MSFIVGFVPIVITSFGIAVALMFSNEEFFTVAKVAVVAHLPLALIEGLIMIFLFKTLKKYQIKGLNL